MHHHVLEFIANLLFWAALHGGPVPAPPVPLATLERPTPTYESVMRDMDVRTWRTR